LDGTTISIQVPSGADVLDVKKALEEEENTGSPLFQAIYFQESKLKDAAKLKDVGVVDGSDLSLVTSTPTPELYTIPGSSIGGAHTNNTSYFKRHSDGRLELITVCWLSVGGGITAANLGLDGVGGICPGKYEVVVLFRNSSKATRFSMDVSTMTRPIVADDAAETQKDVPWTTTKTNWKIQTNGSTREHSIGHVVTGDQSEVKVSFSNTNSGWKSGITWEKIELRLVGLPE
jgi:hypothetical protein